MVTSLVQLRPFNQIFILAYKNHTFCFQLTTSRQPLYLGGKAPFFDRSRESEYFLKANFTINLIQRFMRNIVLKKCVIFLAFGYHLRCVSIKFCNFPKTLEFHIVFILFWVHMRSNIIFVTSANIFSSANPGEQSLFHFQQICTKFYSINRQSIKNVDFLWFVKPVISNLGIPR